MNNYNLHNILRQATLDAIQKLYSSTIDSSNITFQSTRKEFEGDITLVVFPFIKTSKKNPELTGQEIGEYLKTNCSIVQTYNVIKGFLNIVIKDDFWLGYFKNISANGFNLKIENTKTIMVEYSSPNTNKPLHLGHIRNNLLGFSVSEILKTVGHKVIKVNLINDRGIHICKSMLAWQKWGNGET
ncbi:MAG: arginine--tRNA ligase, partial [Bacteroidetes bacterium RIFCSPLOWO2_12_FULL_31_6]